MTIQAVLFDLDETLFDRTGSLRAFLADQHARHPALAAGEQDALVDRFLVLDRRGRVRKSIVYPKLLTDLGVVDHVLADTLVKEYERDFWRFARPFPGLEELLSRLNARGAPTAVVTNGRTASQLRSLMALNLDRMVDAYLISEAEGVRKPDAEIFLRAAAKLGVDPAGCMFVGDSPDADIIGAQQVGMKAVWFPNGAAWPDNTFRRPDAEIASLSQVAALFDDWSR